jgi:hypothetical protein
MSLFDLSATTYDGQAGVHERYFEELAAILAKPGSPDVQAIAALPKRYDTEQVSALST